ncbi:transcription factor bHLH94-like [Lycium barbarum]|uniref:transcription factor bHLH94-like n=1 Tax=Lycium barbarum TaxID=112863 RepID=UPI00293E7D36|nr:transcription factor bHLH94-like [Lycium barbarum]
MALETVVFQQDPFGYNNKDLFNFGIFDDYGLGIEKITIEQSCNIGYWDSQYSSPELCSGNGFLPQEYTPVTTTRQSKRMKRNTCSKNKEEIENQRMTHIDVERNRRRQMKDYLAVLRSLMPPSYAQRGDKASIVGGAINFVKELEQLLQFLEAHTNKQVKHQPPNSCHPLFSSFFTFPQYSTGHHHSHGHPKAAPNGAADGGSGVADIEVTMAESHANIKVLSRKQPKQLLKIVTWLHAMFLTVLHLNVTAVDHMVLYSFSVKVEDNCELNTADDIAAAIYMHEMVAMIQEEAIYV